MNDAEKTDQARRESLKKLASLTAYSTPAVVTLLTPTLSYAQTSEAVNNPSNQNKTGVIDCLQGLRSNLSNLGNNPSGSQNNDTSSDCPNYPAF